VIDRDPVPRSEEYAATEDEYSEVKRDYRAVLEVLRTDDVLDKHVRRVRGRRDSRYRSLAMPSKREYRRRSAPRSDDRQRDGLEADRLVHEGFRERIVDDAGGQRSEQRVSSHPGGEHEKARGQPSVRFAIGIVIASNVESTPVRFHDRCPLGYDPATSRTVERFPRPTGRSDAVRTPYPQVRVPAESTRVANPSLSTAPSH